MFPVLAQNAAAVSSPDSSEKSAGSQCHGKQQYFIV